MPQCSLSDTAYSTSRRRSASCLKTRAAVRHEREQAEVGDAGASAA